jgi:anti-anti-sigma regulatory factor
MNLLEQNLEFASIKDGRSLLHGLGDMDEATFSAFLEVLSHYCRNTKETGK